jgi:hypothetical protein
MYHSILFLCTFQKLRGFPMISMHHCCIVVVNAVLVASLLLLLSLGCGCIVVVVAFVVVVVVVVSHHHVVVASSGSSRECLSTCGKILRHRIHSNYLTQDLLEDTTIPPFRDRLRAKRETTFRTYSRQRLPCPARLYSTSTKRVSL